MARVKVRVLLASLGLATALMTAFGAEAMAQYPPVRGNVVLAAGDATPALGGQTTVSATVVDEAGNAVSGLSCTFSVAQQPGTDASVEQGPFTTDATGRVSTTLNAGSAAGTIVVEAACGELSAAVSVVATSCPQTSGAPSASLFGTGAGVGSSGVATDCPPPPPAAPPASLPDTGAGGNTSGAGRTAWALIGATVFIGASGVALAWRRRRA